MLARPIAFALVVLVLLPFTAPFPVAHLTDFLGGSDDESSATAPLASVEDVTDVAKATVPPRHRKVRLRPLAVMSPGGADLLVPQTHGLRGPAGLEPLRSTRANSLLVLRI